MLLYTTRRLLLMVPMIFAISVLSFVLIQLPPGDYLSNYAASLRAEGADVSGDQMAALEEAYGLNQPIHVQYIKWVEGILLHGNFGLSMEWQTPVADLIWQCVGLTVVLCVCTLLVTWLMAIPIGVYSATHQYSKLDYLFTGIGFAGLGIPGFLIALTMMWVLFAYFGQDVGGLFSEQFKNAPWTVEKVWDMLKHLWVPVLILGWEGTAALIRTMRANLLDELNKPYVQSARARGIEENHLIWEYPVGVALNPFISTLGWALPGLVSSSTIISIVLSLPVAGPLFLRSLQSQDMYLAGSFVLILGCLTLFGTLISDILLAWFDPRIRYE